MDVRDGEGGAHSLSRLAHCMVMEEREELVVSPGRMSMCVECGETYSCVCVYVYEKVCVCVSSSKCVKPPLLTPRGSLQMEGGIA